MNTFFKLFRLQIDEKYNIFKAHNLKKLLWALAKYVVLLAVITLVLYIGMSYLETFKISINAQLLSLVILVTQLVSFIFSLAGIISYLFYNKNNELLLSLPASLGHVFFSKLLVIYAQEIIVNCVYSLPMFLVIGIFGHYGVSYYIFSVLFIFFLPLLPLSVAALLSVPAAMFLRFLKKHTVINIVLIFMVTAAAIFLYINLLSAFSDFNLSGMQLETVTKINNDIMNFGEKNFFFLQISYGIIDIGKSFWVLIYLAISAACLFVAIYPVKAFFLKAAMSSGEEKVEKERKRRYRIMSPFKSLLYKELLMVFRSPGSVFQYFMFALLMPIIVILYDGLLMTLVVNQVGEVMINGAHVMIVAILAMLSNIVSASAISREGGCFYIVKTSPISYYTQTAAKVTFNAIITVSAIVITGIVTLIYMPLNGEANYSIPAYVSICTTIAVAFAALGHIFQSFDMDLKKPVLNWYDAGDISKVSTNTAKSIGYGLTLGLIMGLIIMLLSSFELAVLPWIALIVLSVGFCAYKAYVLYLRVSYRYDSLET